MDFSHLWSQGSDIVAAALMILGGLKVIARYTPFEWDDHALAAAEKPFNWLKGIFNKESK